MLKLLFIEYFLIDFRDYIELQYVYFFHFDTLFNMVI